MRKIMTAHRDKKLAKITNDRKIVQAGQARAKTVDSDFFAQRVEEKAYELYETRGRQDGNDWKDWFDAQKIVEAEMITGQ